MKISKVTPEEYRSLFTPRTVYGSVDFNLLNAHKVDDIAWLAAFDDNDRPRMGLIAGLSDGLWSAPFSAPFTEISVNGPLSVERAHLFANEVISLLGTLSLTLAPSFYDEATIPCLTAAFGNCSRHISFDYNYHYFTSDAPDFEAHLIPTARNKLRHADKAGLQFIKTDDIERAYSIIAFNRGAHGYYLAMSLADVISTVSKVVNADFFVLNDGNEDIAAAMVYRVTPDIAQVIYWGDAPSGLPSHPMNLLPREIFNYYHREGFKIIDVGPASNLGYPNVGLCRFKSSLGCHLTTKPTFNIY